MKIFKDSLLLIKNVVLVHIKDIDNKLVTDFKAPDLIIDHEHDNKLKIRHL